MSLERRKSEISGSYPPQSRAQLRPGEPCARSFCWLTRAYPVLYPAAFDNINVKLIAWNEPWWQYLHYGNWQMSQIRVFLSESLTSTPPVQGFCWSGTGQVQAQGTPESPLSAYMGHSSIAGSGFMLTRQTSDSDSFTWIFPKGTGPCDELVLQGRDRQGSHISHCNSIN